MKYLLLQYFAVPIARTGTQFLLISYDDHEKVPSLEVREAPEWRTDVRRNEDLEYMDALIASFRASNQDLETLFSELECMSCGPVQVVDQGQIAREELNRLIA